MNKPFTICTNGDCFNVGNCWRFAIDASGDNVQYRREVPEWCADFSDMGLFEKLSHYFPNKINALRKREFDVFFTGQLPDDKITIITECPPCQAFAGMTNEK